MAKGIEIREAHFPGRAPIDAYGNGGFRFADMSHRGSILCLPSGIHGWDKDESTPLTLADLQRVLDEAGDIEVLLVGTGKDIRPLPADIKAALRERKIDDIVRYAEARGAEELDRHIGPNLTLVRLQCDGEIASNIL